MDPLTSGHVDLLHDAETFGHVLVALNSDDWLLGKKGYVFQSYQERARILLAIKYVYAVVAFDDSDGTVCDALKRYRPDYFANGGDRDTPHPAEDAVCRELHIEQLFNIGGPKTSSSSELVRRAAQSLRGRG